MIVFLKRSFIFGVLACLLFEGFAVQASPLLLSVASKKKSGAGNRGGASASVAEDLKKLQNHIDETQASLKRLQEKWSGKNEGQSDQFQQAFVKTYFSSLVMHLQKRGHQVTQGLESLFEEIKFWLNESDFGTLVSSSARLLLAFALVTFLGVCVALFVQRGSSGKGFIGGGVKWALSELQGRPRIHSVYTFLAALLSGLLPPALMFVTMVSLFFLLEHHQELRAAMWSFASGLFWWGAVWRLKDILFQYVPNWFLGSNAQRTRHRLLFSVKFFLFFWIANDWLVTLLGFSEVSPDASIFVMLLAGLGMALSALSIVRLIRRPLWRWLQKHQEQRFPVLTTIFWASWNTFPIVLYVLFVLDEQSFMEFFWPIVLTIILLPLIPILYINLKRLRIMYLMGARRDPHQGYWFRLLRKQRQALRLFYLVSYAFVGVCIIELWDLKVLLSLKAFLGDGTYDQLADIAFISFLGWAAIHFGDRILRHYLDRRAAEQVAASLYVKGRLRTLLMTSRTVLRISVFVTCALIIFAKLGYNITPIITNLGLLSVVLSFGMQSFVKDFFAGLLILLDNNLVVGDWADIDGKLGIVEELSLRTIKIRADNGTLMTIPFGGIRVIGNRSRHFSCFLINLPVPYNTNPERAQQFLEEAYQKLKRMPAYRKKILQPIEIRGVNDIVSYAMVMQAKIRTNPTEQEFVRRGYNKVLKEILDREKVQLPYPPYPSAESTSLSVSGKLMPAKK